MISAPVPVVDNPAVVADTDGEIPEPFVFPWKMTKAIGHRLKSSQH